MPINFWDSMCAKVSPSARKGEVSGWGHKAPYRPSASPRAHPTLRTATPRPAIAGGAQARPVAAAWAASKGCSGAGLVKSVGMLCTIRLSAQHDLCGPVLVNALAVHHAKSPGHMAWGFGHGGSAQAASFDQSHFHSACLGIAAEDDSDGRLLQQDAGRRHAQFEQLLLYRQGALLGQLSVRCRISRGIVKT